jgi:ubiquinol-cytochrome c reductase cytochrome c1 subunit
MDKVKVIARLFTVFALLAMSQSFAAGGAALDHADIDPGNKASLQRGARNFMNYCSGCHSAKYMRFNTIGKYLELSEEQLIENLMFNAEKTFETINTAMPASSALRWFGTAPPDMSLMARAKGADYIYSFLRGFYLEPNSPTGVDNRVLGGTSMPHVLWELQGYQKALFSSHSEGDATSHTMDGFELVIGGSMDNEDFDDFVRDTVNFLVYISEPIRSERRKLGVWVLMFLIFFWILSVMLKKQIWKDVT